MPALRFRFLSREITIATRVVKQLGDCYLFYAYKKGPNPHGGGEGWKGAAAYENWWRQSISTTKLSGSDVITIYLTASFERHGRDLDLPATVYRKRKRFIAIEFIGYLFV